MSRRAVVALSLAVVLISAGVVFGVMRSGGSDDIPLYAVSRASFQRRVTAEGNLKAAKATPLSAPNDAPGALKIAWLAEDGVVVKTGEVLVRFDPTEFENTLVVGNEDDTTSRNRMSKASTESTTTRTNLKRDAAQADDELKSAQRFQKKDASIFSRYQLAESELDEELAMDRREYATDVLSVRDQLSAAEFGLLSIEQRKALLKIRNAQQGLRSLEVVAPHEGILVLQRDWRGELPRVGSTIWSGNTVGEIPDLAKMEAEVFVLEADAAGIAVGQTARVSLESNSAVTYQGKILRIDKLARPRLRGVPVQYFGVRLELDKTVRSVMKPGARVRAVIEVENQKDVVVVPRQAIFNREGKKVVYRKTGRKYQPVEVTMASSSLGRIVITKGLKGGEVVALRDPTKDDEQKPSAKSSTGGS